ncbi:MAG: hypothetical protein IPI82_03690 [Candidatus Microthrix sp.]|nr:hypothetical protein [Candidatus Microthrix sp.]MBK7321571.1 hypothetical protein [Candidatus Microthrix sp.]
MVGRHRGADRDAWAVVLVATGDDRRRSARGGGPRFHLASLASVIAHRRRSLELLHGFVLASAAFLVIAIMTGIVAGLAPIDTELRTRLVVTEVFS